MTPRRAILAWALAIAAYAAACTVDRRSTELACETSAECASDRVCVDRVCILASAGGDGGPVGQCPSGCTRCSGGRCIIDCANRTCGAVICPAGWGCDITCTQNSCASINCTGGLDCAITCTGTAACDNVDCGERPCAMTCTGRRACTDVTCDDSCRCDVTCTTLDACNNNIDCPLGCDRLGGCTSEPLQCNTCI